MVLDRHQTDLYVRPSWLDAAIALRQIEKVRWFTHVYIQHIKIGILIVHSRFLSQNVGNPGNHNSSQIRILFLCVHVSLFESYIIFIIWSWNIANMKKTNDRSLVIQDLEHVILQRMG